MKKIHHGSAPTLIPRVILDVHADGTLTASVDGSLLDPPSAGPWRRSSLGQIIDLATGGRTAPAQVEVRESDGTGFTDFITPGSRSRNKALDAAAAAEEAVGTAEPPVFAAVVESGFLPAEDVAIAVIVGHADASPAGMARALLDPTHSPAGEVILLGRVSGTLVIRRLP